MGSSFWSLVRRREGPRIRRVVVVLTVMSLSVAVSASCATPLLSVTVAEPDGSGGNRPDGGHLTCPVPRGSDPFAAAGAEDLDMDRERLRRAVSYATARGAQSVRIYRHGCLVARSGNDPVTEKMRLAGWSMTKGVVSVVVGRAAAMGLLSVDDPISKYLDGFEGIELDQAHGELTIRQFLTQTTGLRMAWVNDLWAAGSTDSAADELARPFQAEPGSTFLYAQTAVTVLVAVVEAATGEDFGDFARRELFEPLGIPGSSGIGAVTGRAGSKGSRSWTWRPWRGTRWVICSWTKECGVAAACSTPTTSSRVVRAPRPTPATASCGARTPVTGTSTRGFPTTSARTSRTGRAYPAMPSRSRACSTST
ncbi:MAG: serine hydrolase [Microthrixaceae bacterium]|nr:serine hydrolase [Microthrixaceae bacterium]